jgi:hypothetical protein
LGFRYGDQLGVARDVGILYNLICRFDNNVRALATIAAKGNSFTPDGGHRQAECNAPSSLRRWRNGSPFPSELAVIVNFPNGT